MMLEPERIIDRYRIEERLGEGGFSVVYRVRHVTLGTDHALKLLKVQHADFHQRLLREGRMQAQLIHPNVLSVRDVVAVDAAPGLILDLVTGGTLAQLLDARRPSLADIDDLARGILQGVRAAHTLGLVHRDLKPANVLLDVTPERVIPKVADFGLARLLLPTGPPPTGTSTRSNVLMGTPSYMSPELIENAAESDERADLFALGAVLYELLTGRLAFSGDKVADIPYRVANAHYVPISEVMPAAPLRMQRAIEAALIADPADRVRSADAMLALWCGSEAPETLPSSFEQGRRLGIAGGAPAIKNARPSPHETLIPQSPSQIQQLVVLAAVGGLLGAALVLWQCGESRRPPASIVAERTVTDEQPRQYEFVGPPSSRPLESDPTPSDPTAVPSPSSNPHAPARSTHPQPTVPLPTPAIQVAPRPAPAASAAAPGMVEVQGDGVDRVDLVRRIDGDRHAPGDNVPPGMYDLVVWFIDEPAVPIELGLRIESGRSLVVACDADFYTCALVGSR